MECDEHTIPYQITFFNLIIYKDIIINGIKPPNKYKSKQSFYSKKKKKSKQSFDFEDSPLNIIAKSRFHGVFDSR